MPFDQTIIPWLTGIILQKPPAWPNQTETISEEIIQQAAMEHGVLALCSFQLYHIKNRIPQDLTETFKNAERQAAVTELLQEIEIKTVLKCLHDKNIETLLFKGTPLAYSIYERPYLRPRCDTDLLFPDKNTAEYAWSALKILGYQRPNAASGSLITNEFSCYKQSRGGLIHCFDFHWKLNNNHSFARTFSFDELMQDAVVVEALLQSPAPSPVHALLIACMHRLAHSTDGMANRLIWLYDIHLLAQTLSPEHWKTLLFLAVEKRLSTIVSMGLHAAVETFATLVPQVIFDQLKHAPTTEQFAPTIWQSRRQTDLANLRSLDRSRDQIQFLYQHFFPPPDYMYRKYRTENRMLLPFLYVQRIIKGLPKLLK